MEKINLSSESINFLRELQRNQKYKRKIMLSLAKSSEEISLCLVGTDTYTIRRYIKLYKDKSLDEYLKFSNFKNSILSFFKNIKNYKDKLSSLFTLNSDLKNINSS